MLWLWLLQIIMEVVGLILAILPVVPGANDEGAEAIIDALFAANAVVDVKALVLLVAPLLAALVGSGPVILTVFVYNKIRGK